MLRRMRNPVYEPVIEVEFPHGIQLKGYTCLADEINNKECRCSKKPKPKQKITAIDNRAIKILEKQGVTAYTIEIYFIDHSPLIYKGIIDLTADPYSVIYDNLSDSFLHNIKRLEYIQIEYIDGELYEFTDKDIEEIKYVIGKLKKGGFIKNNNMNVMF